MHFRRIGKLLIAFAALFALYAATGFLALPRIIHSEAVKYVSEKTGYRLNFDLPQFNPFTFDLDLSNLHLDKPDGKTLASFKSLKIGFSASGLFSRTLIIESADLDGPETSFVLQKDGQSNWSEFLGKFQSNSSSRTKLEVARFRMKGGRIDFTDEKNGFSSRIEPIELDLDDISTGKAGRFRLSARSDSAAVLAWAGKIMISPLEISGRMELAVPEMKAFSAYFRGMPASPQGAASLSAECRLAPQGVILEDVNMKASRIRGKSFFIEGIEAKRGSYDLEKGRLSMGLLAARGSSIGSRKGKPFMNIDTLRIEDIDADLSGKRLKLGRISIEKGKLDLSRNRKGEIALDMPESSGGASQPWHYSIAKIGLAGFSAHLEDQSVSPPASLNLNSISVELEKITDNLSLPLPIRASMKVEEGGSLEAQGKVIPAEKSAEMNLRIRDLALKPGQPYLSSYAKLSIAGGTLDADGHAAFGAKGMRYKGGILLKDLRLLEKGTNHVLLSWQSLATANLEATPSKLDIGTLDLDRPYTKLIIARNKSVNIAKILKKRPPTNGKSAFQLNIDRIRVRAGEMDYADYSLALPFGTRIHKLHGFVNGISSSPGSFGQVRLSGRVDEYGSVNASGQVDLFDPKNMTDIKVKFSNIEMTRLTPYSATFAGRKIDSGKLTLDLDYRIKDHKLTGDDQIIMDNLTLGGRVESPEAKDLPLDLAIAILEDSQGRIELGLPVSGSLDDPKFSYGGIIWKAIERVFEKIVTAPFRLLGALFGGGEKFEKIYFEPGKTDLSPPEIEKLARLSGALEKRPGLFLTVHGVYSDADRTAIRDLKARREVVLASGQHLTEQDPGPISTNSPRIRAAIEKLFSEKFGKAELISIKEGFGKLNHIDEGFGEKVKSGISGLFLKKRALSEEEQEQLRGADLHAFLFRRLRQAEKVENSELQALGKARGDALLSILKESGAPMERVNPGTAEKVDDDAQGVPVKLELGASHG